MLFPFYSLLFIVVININLIKCYSDDDNDSRSSNNSISSDNSVQIPDFIKVCHKSDKQLNECIRNSIESLRPYFPTGIPEFGIPVCEPLIIPKVSLDQNSGAIKLHSEFHNITVYGPSKFHLRSIKVDPIKNRFYLKMWFPELKMNAIYKIKGNLLMMPLQGTGTCFGNYSDVDAVAALKGERYINKLNGMEYLEIKDFFIEFNIGDASVQLNDLFNGDPELGRTMNKFLNENWKLVAAEMRPAVEEKISDILLDIANIIFEKFPIDLLIPE